jgi:hypothetical protein
LLFCRGKIFPKKIFILELYSNVIGMKCDEIEGLLVEWLREVCAKEKRIACWFLKLSSIA